VSGCDALRFLDALAPSAPRKYALTINITYRTVNSQQKTWNLPAT